MRGAGRPDVRPGRARLRDGRGRRRRAARRRRAPSPAPTCPPSSSCWASTSPASATRSPTTDGALELVYSDAVAGHLQEARRLRRRHAAARRRSWSATRRRTACCGRWSRSGIALPGQPGGADPPGRPRRRAELGLPDEAQVCSCNNVTKGADPATPSPSRAATTSPASRRAPAPAPAAARCVPLVKNLHRGAARERRARSSTRRLCEHFPLTRQELFDVVAVHGYRRFDEIVEAHGTGRGCDICKPAVASILASQLNGHVLDGEHRAAPGHQRRLPRQHPAQRHLLGRAAHPRRRDHAREADRDRRGRPRLRPLHEDHRRPADRPVRRPDGAAAGDLAAAGRRRLRVRARLRQGAAHGEVVRRLDLVPLRRAGLASARDRRSSCATAGCARRTSSRAASAAAPASAPRRGARTSASSPPRRAGTSTSAATAAPTPRTPSCSPATSTRETLVRYLDRFLMYYIRTADRLQRTAAWIESLDGGLDRVREVVVDDALGLGAELEAAMARHVDALLRRVEGDPRRPGEAGPVRVVRQRPRHPGPEHHLHRPSAARSRRPTRDRPVVARRDDPGGRRRERTEWSRSAAVDADRGRGRRRGAGRRRRRSRSSGHTTATSTRSRQPRPFLQGVGAGSRASSAPAADVPFVASPMHKQAFDLRTGQCLDDAAVRVPTYDVRVDDGIVLVGRPTGESVSTSSLPLDGFRIGVTAARKVDEQIALLERRGAAVEWAPALSMDPNQVDDAELRAATEEVLSRPVDMFLATTGIGMKAWFAARRAVGAAARPAGRARRRRDPGPRPEERRRAAPARAARAVGAGVGVLRGRARAPARPRPDGLRIVVQEHGQSLSMVAHALRRQGADVDDGDRLPGRGGRGPGADVPADRPDRRPRARRGHLHLRARRRRADGGRRLDRPARRAGRGLPGRRGRRLRRAGDRGGVRDVGRADDLPRALPAGRDGQAARDRAARRGATGSTIELAGGHQLLLHGDDVLLDGVEVRLSPAPARRAAGAGRQPRPRGLARRRCWPRCPSGTAGSEHAVEMAVARLRAALGTRAVQTVVKRGYRLAVAS